MLQNCIAFPQISSFLARGSLTKAARATALKAGIDEGSYYTSDTVRKVIAECLEG